MATISSLLADHVTLQVRSVDRLFFQGYVPRLQTQFQVIRFLLDRGFPIPSPVVLGRIGREYVSAVENFIVEHEIPVVRFQKGDVKEDIAREHFKAAEAEGRFGVVMVGIAQERTSAWRGWRNGGPDGHPHFEYRRQSIFPNNYYWYIRDPDWGPAFLKTTAYAPYSVWLYLNGNEWAKRQAIQRDIPFKALDNGFAACDDPVALADICASLSAAEVQAFFDRWQATLPSPLSAEDRARGYRHELAFRQAEISDTRMFDRPAAGRAWFERTLPRPANARPPRPGRDRVRPARLPPDPGPVSHQGLQQGRRAGDPGSLPRLEGQAVLQRGPRATDRDDRQRHPRLRHWPPPHPGKLGRARRQVGDQVNQRFLEHQLQACQCAPDATTLQRVVLPSIEDGLAAPGLRFGEPRTMALLACLCCFQHLFAGLTNRSLRELIAGLIPGYNAHQMTYDLRRLRRKRFIQRIPRTHRYELTSEGRRLAVFLTKTYTRIVNPSLAELDPALPPDIAERTPLAKTWRAFERAIQDRINEAAIAA